MSIWLVIFELASVNVTIAQVQFSEPLHLVLDPLAFIYIAVAHDDLSKSMFVAINEFSLVKIATFLLDRLEIWTLCGLNSHLCELLAKVVLHQLRLSNLIHVSKVLHVVWLIELTLVDGFFCNFIFMSIALDDGVGHTWDLFDKTLGDIC